ncbi:MAG: type II toxin-antitoxin system VapB family antitoxin [Acidimicrobiales bacterium]
MTKRLIDIDDRLLHSAQTALGTTTYKETVRQALEGVLAERRQGVDDVTALLRAFSSAITDLSDPEVMAAAWR